ncbi:MAG: trypsin-like peptidase domain-containing protein [Chloroflexi bacterium]|nr:trypsin-like peptidase domain-containing protein [Chloroflexota bacterium]
MKLHTIHRIWIMLAALFLISLACIGPGIQPVPTQVPTVQPTPIPQNSGSSNNGQTTINRADMIKATVQIYALKSENGQLTPIYWGSGTIISPTGLILTNAHVASPASQGDTENEPDALAILLMDQEDKPPVFSYFASVKAVDGYLDLAVIQITSTMEGADVNPSSLNLPFVQLGNSDTLHVGDHINIFGFPGIGGETITFTDGSVSGFTAEEGLGDRAWIKTNATISGGNSGGLAANDAGLIIGVPTLASAGTGGDITDCRVVQDTNGDGVVDSNDTCIPIGGFINGIRPLNLALPLINAAKSEHAYASPFDQTSPPTSTGSGSESFGAITWYSVTGGSDCQLADQVNAFPPGTIAMAAAFSFNGMTDGEPWAEAWTVDGDTVYSDQYSWNSGSQGNTSTCVYNTQSGMPEGNYHIELYAGQNLDLLTQSDVVVGGSANNGPSQPSDQGVVTVFGQVLDADSNNPLPGAEIYVLNPGITFDQWKANDFADADIFSFAKADDQGNYSLPDKLSLDVGYTLVVYVEGYKITYGDNNVWTSQDPLNYQWDISMSK